MITCPGNSEYWGTPVRSSATSCPPDDSLDPSRSMELAFIFPITIAAHTTNDSYLFL